MERLETHLPVHENLLTMTPTEPAPDEDMPTPIVSKITRTEEPYVQFPAEEVQRSQKERSGEGSEVFYSS
jgi:hypothetical protein